MASVDDLAAVPLFSSLDEEQLATVTSTSPARLLVLFGTEFRQLEAAHPEIASRIAGAMQARAGQIAELA